MSQEHSHEPESGLGDAETPQEGENADMVNKGPNTEIETNPKREIILTEKARQAYEETVKKYSAKLNKITSDIETVYEKYKQSEKSVRLINICRDDAKAYMNKYRTVFREFDDILSRSKSAEAKGERQLQESILSGIVQTFETFVKDLKQVKQTLKQESRTHRSTGKSSKLSSRATTVSSAGSILLKQRTKAETAKKRLEFASKEAALVREQAELKVNMDLLVLQKEAAIAEVELKVLEDELNDLDYTESDDSSVIDSVERTKQYVMDQHSVFGRDPVVKTENVSFALKEENHFIDSDYKHTPLNPKTLNPCANPFEMFKSHSSVPSSVNNPHMYTQYVSSNNNEMNVSRTVNQPVSSGDMRVPGLLVDSQPIIGKSSMRASLHPHIDTQPATGTSNIQMSDTHVPVSSNVGSYGVNSNIQVANELTKFLLKKDLLMSCFTNYNDQAETYPIWKASFLSLSRELGVSPREELDLLIKWLGPESSKFALSLRVANANDPKKALERIWQRLEERFGRPEMVESALKQKLDRFPKITNRDHKRLYELSDLLSEIECVKDNPRYSTLLAYFDASSGVKQVVEKLPYYLQSKWTDRAMKYKNANYVPFPPFTFFVQFIREMSTQYNDPGFAPMETKEPPFRTRPSRSTLAVSAKKTEIERSGVSGEKHNRCPIHKSRHSLNECKTFRQKSLGERKRFLKYNNICFKCCETDAHMFKDCKESIKCSDCGSSYHPSAMHTDRSNQSRPPTAQITSASASANGGENQDISISTNCLNVCGQDFTGRSCSKTILVKVYPTGKPQDYVKLYALIDDQSNRTLGRPEFFDRMNISKAETRHYTLTSCSGHVPGVGRCVTGYTIESIDGNTKMELPAIIECTEIPVERKEIPTPDVTLHHEHLTDIPIPPLDPDADILMLIGRDLIEAHHVYKQCTGPKNSPFAQPLNLGWVIIGDVCLGTTHKPDAVNVYKTCVLANGRPTVFQQCENNFLIRESDDSGSDIFKKTREDDKIGTSVEDRKFMNKMDSDFILSDNGHFTAPLPFRSARPRLPDNRCQALKRARSLEYSLRRDSVKKEQFTTFMQRVLDNGHAEIAPPLQENEECWFLPLFGVYHPKKKDQIRVVFDSLAKHDDISLNSVLMSGPDLTNNLVGVLLRFRKEPVAIIADIQQMFYGFYVVPEHRNFLRFFWYKNNDIDDDLIEYRMCVHVFGNCPSPAVATYGLRKCVEDEQKYGSDVKDFVEKNFYVDDGLASFASASQAIDVVKRTQLALATEGKLRLHKIASTDKSVMSAFPSEDLAKDLGNLEFGSEELPMQHSLGLCWNINSDSFTYKISDAERPITRRGVLSTVNSLFDPLGFIAPVIVNGRILMRDIVSETTDWDSPLPEAYHQKWREWTDSLKTLEGLDIPRAYVSTSLSGCTDMQVHVFSDASEKAIAAVAYVRTVDGDDRVNVGFVLGKSKLAPKHGHTIPRLELCAAVLAVEVGEIVSEQLGFPLDQIRYHTDSKVVLGYLQNEVRRFYVYVCNRVATIRKLSDRIQWSYVSTESNPADYGTRPVPAHRLRECSWLYGPSFLWRDENSLYKETFPLVDPENDAELRPEVEVHKTSVKSSSHLGSKRFQKFSRWRNLVNTISRLQHIARGFSQSRDECHGWHICSRFRSVESFRKAEQFVIKEVQAECYAKEIDALRRGEQLHRDSSILSLSPFLDEHGILRVGGRLKSSKLPLDEKMPILIPGRHYISILLARHCHESVQHQGRHFTEGGLRSAGYWITGAKRIVSSLLFKCVVFRKLRGRLSVQKMSDLPVDRLSPSPPFTFVGVDVFGPWTVVTRKTRGGTADSKRWCVTFTCLSCRAVHLELIEEMSSSSFINALRRFYALRGVVKEFRSDRGTNFVGAVGDLGINAVNVEDGPVGKLLYDSGTVWKFNPPHASHMGGSWERLIGVTRRILDAMLSDVKYKNLTHEVLATFMAEVTAIINNRPIVPVSSDSESPLILTPSTLLTQKTSNGTDSFQHLDVRDMYRSQWKYVQVLAETFWTRWRQEFLPRLQQRQKWSLTTPNVQEGDVILLRDKGVARNYWPVGMVVRVFPSEDKLVRKVEVRVMKDGKPVMYVRPISEIVKLLSK